MTTSIATQAFQLYVDTFALESTPYDHPEFHNMYAKECQLFDLMRQFTPEDSTLYAQLICEWNAKVEEMYRDTDPNLADMI